MFTEDDTEQKYIASGHWAEVILPLYLPTVYTYGIPLHLLPQAKRGCRAEVILGRSKKYAGVIRSISGNEPAYKTKFILNIIDDEPLLYPQQLELWRWISEYYMCTEGEVMAAALPVNFRLSSETIIIFNEEAGDEFSHLTDNEFLVAEALLLKKQLNITEVQEILGSSHALPVIKHLIEKNICHSWEQMNERYKVKLENFVELKPDFTSEHSLSELLNNWKGSSKQMEIVLSFLHLSKTAAEVKQSDLLKKSGASTAQLKAVIDKGILFVHKRPIDRVRALPKTISIDFELSIAQQKSLNEINASFEKKDVCLLHGVTGSGKTQIYIHLIEKNFKEGLQALYLLPEIALTGQIIRRLQKHFGGNIAIYHSKFNDQERIELWNKVRTGEVRIILGARSALFLPFINLGLVIVDEEHDASYKQQEPPPRYNARDAAIFYASLFDAGSTRAKLLLGSATPSIESYFNARQDKYGFVTLNERFAGIQLPAIQVINSRQVAQKGKVILSPQLKEAITREVDAGKQVILFQNRRGYNPYLICRICGNIPQCQHCDVSLTLHKQTNKLHCHYCGSTYPKLLMCPACGTQGWLEKNFGTEKIEELLEDEFPRYRIIRMDIDSVRGKNAHDNLIRKFEQQQVDVLVGTQMVVKGLDFDNVTLVGILDADGLLNYADFRVNERAFQLMEQVSGRAGRKGAQGNVLLQAMNVDHPVIKLLQQHDYVSMFETELQARRSFFYPPFSRIVKLTLRYKDSSVLNAAALKLTSLLQQDLKDFVVGPATPVIPRMRNQYLQEIMIKLPKQPGMSIRYKKVIRNHINLLVSEPPFKNILVTADVDPI